MAALVTLIIGLTAALVPGASPVLADEPATPTVGEAAGRFLAEETRWHADAVVVGAATAADVLLAWAATGSEYTAAQQVKDTVVATIGTRTGLENTARTLLALAVYDVDITAVGARNLDADLRGFQFTEGVNDGRFKTSVAGTTPSNSVPIHARAMLALAMTEGGVPVASTAALAGTQCANGSFPATWGSTTCNGLEVTALAAQALRAGGNTVDAAEAEAWIASVQATDGSFTATNGANSDLVGLASQTLRAGGNTAAADAAAAYVTSLQVTPDAAVWDHDKGAIAQTPARLATAITAGEIGLGVRFANFRLPTMRAVLALGAPALVELSAPPVSEPPAEPQRWYEGACEPDDGVTVVADFRTITDRLEVRCALGNQISGWAALANAGYVVGSVQGYPGAAICQVGGLPEAGFPTCWYDGYWSYWHAPNSDAGTEWTYSSLGYNNRKPALNSVEGSRYVQLSSPNAPPAVGPNFPTPVVDITSGPEATTLDDTATFEFTSSEVESTTTCTLDDGDPAPCASPLELTDLPAGEHELTVTATTPAARSGRDTWSWRVLGPAECGIVPQAPTFDIIDSAETLTFTLADGHPIETAVLTDLDADGASATFTPGAVVDLAEHEGSEIRVLARRAGGGCPADEMFDSTYDVRDAYAPRWNLATAPGHPSPTIATASVPAGRWATGHANYTPGANVTANFQTPNGGLGSPASGLVVLGDRGRIDLTFDHLITDGPGYDLAIWENGFPVGNVANGIDFLEVGYVEVSSNGTDFSRFDSASRQETTVGGFTGQRAEYLGGMAGKDLSGRGTPFDLALLRNRPEVRNGTVDLSRISHVRIVDITGDGLDLDSFGRPIYDAHPTTGSGGFDLTGAAALNIVDEIAPVVTIVEAPSGVVSATDASVSFTVDDATATVEYRIDGGDWASAVSPLAFTGLADGNHTVEVRATDPAGNEGSASAAWTVDATAPVVTITNAPPAVSTEHTATIGYAVDDPAATVEYRVNGGDWTAVEASPIELVDLFEDAYTVEVRATDAAGNSHSVEVTWQIDVVPPELRITTPPTTPSPSRSGEVAFEVGDDATTVECRATATAAWTPCTSPWTGTVETDGDHVMTVRAVDAVGNEMTADAYWSVDTVAPVVVLTETPAASTISTEATFVYDLEDWTGITTVECRLDGGAWAGCPDPIAYSGLSVGPHTFEVRARDTAHNVGSISFTWNVVAPRSANEAWVWAAYEDFLDREPSASELSAAVARLDGGVARSTLARELATSDEWLSVIVTGFYVDTLGRSPGASEVAYWVGELRSGRRSVAQVAASFYASPEYFGGIGGATNASWVADLYVKLLGRSATAADIEYWSGRVIAKGRGWVALQMFQSLESRRARVEALYQELLGRRADAAGRDYWAGRLTNEGDIALARSLASSPEYLDRAQVRFP